MLTLAITDTVGINVNNMSYRQHTNHNVVPIVSMSNDIPTTCQQQVDGVDVKACAGTVFEGLDAKSDTDNVNISKLEGDLKI